MSFDIVTREMWGSMPEVRIPPPKMPVKNVVVMSIKSSPCKDLASCKECLIDAQFHNREEQGLDDIRYNFMVADDGTIYEGRGWQVQPALPATQTNLNSRAFLIGYIGNYTALNLPEKMSTAAQRLVEYGIQHEVISDMFFYHDIRFFSPEPDLPFE